MTIRKFHYYLIAFFFSLAIEKGEQKKFKQMNAEKREFLTNNLFLLVVLTYNTYELES